MSYTITSTVAGNCGKIEVLLKARAFVAKVDSHGNKYDKAGVRFSWDYYGSIEHAWEQCTDEVQWRSGAT